MAKRKRPRRAKLIDWRVQGSLLKHTLIHWLLVLAATFIFALCWQVLAGGIFEPMSYHLAEIWNRYWPLVFALVLLAPVIVYDSLKVSHRFTGPVVRLRRELKTLAEGNKVSRLQFREGDFWQEMAGEFNAVARRIELQPPRSGDLEPGLTDQSLNEQHVETEQDDQAPEPEPAGHV